VKLICDVVLGYLFLAVLSGQKKSFSISRKVVCNKCRGTGAKGGETKKCPVCKGSGTVV